MNYKEFVSKLIVKLNENDFHSSNNFDTEYEISEKSNFIIFSKPSERSYTFINIINANNFDKMIYDEIKKNFEESINNFFKDKSTSNVFCLDLFIGENEVVDEILNSAPPYNSEFIFNIFWRVSLEKNLVFTSTNQPSKIYNIEKYIKQIFDDTKPVENYNFFSLLKKGEKNSKLDVKKENGILPYLIIFINLFIYTIMSMQTKNTTISIEVLYNFGAFVKSNVIYLKEYWRFFTPIFLHLTLAHVVYNCLSIFVFGTRVEKYFGSVNFVIIYILTGIVGNFFALFNSRFSISVGASGSIYGLIGAVGAMALVSRKKLDGFSFYLVVIFVLVGFISDIFTPNVGRLTHIGGLISGFIIGLILYFFTIKKPEQKTE